jgi:carbonic anhydrase
LTYKTKISEHRVNGFRYKLEAHFVFKSPKTSALSVLGAFFKIGYSSSPLIKQVVPFLPSKKGEKTEIPSLDLSFMKCATSQTETVFKVIYLILFTY